ncbi:MAG TPA: TraR/DksA C4-type zinc finger protein [Kofleriaceae bacterium]
MTPESFDPRKIRDRLDTRRAQLLARYRDATERAEEELATPPRELIDVASEQWDARLLSEMTDADARALEGVIAAIRRLDAGRYGVCAACGQPIEPARLRALPEAAECAACARFAEETPPRWVFSTGEER